MPEEGKETKKPFKLMGPFSAPRESPSRPAEKPETNKTRKIEKKEIKKAEFGASLDKKKLAEIDPAKILKEVDFIFEEEGQRDAKIKELERIKEVMMRLPERLEFKPGITLIVGENGSGKTTLAKAFHYIAQIEWIMANDPIIQNKEEATKSVLEPSPNWGGIIDIKNAGLAPHIAKAMSATDYAATEGSEITRYWDFAKEAGRLAHLHEQIATDAWMRRKGGEGAPIGLNQESNRQSVDRIMVESIRREKGRAKGPQVNFFDEPEVGMSPMRHMKLLEEVESFSAENSIAIVPTNSPVFFANSDIPRIDLRYPERGIFKPKDYPDEE